MLLRTLLYTDCVLEDYGKYNFPQEKEIGCLNMTKLANVNVVQISGIMQMTRLR